MMCTLPARPTDRKSSPRCFQSSQSIIANYRESKDYWVTHLKSAALPKNGMLASSQSA